MVEQGTHESGRLSGALPFVAPERESVHHMPMLKSVRAKGGDYNRDPAAFNRVGVIPPTDPIFRDLKRLVNP